MKIKITSKADIPEETRKYAQEKAAKIEKYGKIRGIDVVMEREGEQYSVDFKVSMDGVSSPVVGGAKAGDWLGAIDQAIDKVERQAQKAKAKLKDKRGKAPKAGKKEAPGQKEENYQDAVDKMDEI